MSLDPSQAAALSAADPETSALDLLADLVHQWKLLLLGPLLAAALAGIPLLFGGFGSLTAGAISGRLLERGVNVVKIRRRFAYVGFTGASVLLMASFYIRDPLLAMFSMGMASFCNDLTMPGSWSTCMDVGGKYAGTMSGSMNMMGNFGGMAGPLVVGLVLANTNRDWQLAFAISSIIYFMGAICWIWIDPVTPLDQESTDASGKLKGQSV